MTGPDLLREIAERNRDVYARQRMGALIEAYLAPVPSTRAETVAASPVAGATRPECWRPAVGRAPAATTYADGPTSVGRPGGGGTASRPHPSTSTAGTVGTAGRVRMGRVRPATT